MKKYNIILLTTSTLLLTACPSGNIDIKNGLDNSSSKMNTNEILRLNSGNILSPKDVNSISKERLKTETGFKVLLKWENLLNTKEKITEMELLESDGNQYLFSYMVDGKMIDNPKFLYINGIQHTSYSGKPFSNSELYGECKFVIGECVQQVTKSRKRKIETSFKNGKWIRKYRGHGNSPAMSITIYDKLGLELYREYQAKNSAMEMHHVTNRKM